ncbi:MAG: tetratricopeptide repeat protein [Lewinellaceae bacterium]|nr:tetratricopeptide repeat protein [Saprospiraceae bacterium]MCB9333867.1 tetratricopeptide repeat protein [Lewinellaceae bacterium]
MQKKYALFFWLVLGAAGLTAQVNADSLWQMWHNSSLHDTTRLRALNTLAFSYANSKPDSARIVAELQLAFARGKKMVIWQARALNSMGLACRVQSDYPKAIQHYEESIRLLKQAGDRSNLASVYGNLADVYRIQSDLPKAIDYISKTLALAEATGDRKKAADAYVSIATMYYEYPGNEGKTLEYLNKARLVYESLKSEVGLTLVYGNLSAVYLDREDYDKALEFNEKTIALQKKQGNTLGLATSLHNRATIFGYQGRHREAMADFNREIEIFSDLGDLEGLADAYNSMGELWLHQGRYILAIDACEKALQTARQMGGPNLEAQYACECLYHAYLEQGNYRQALLFLQQTMNLKDSLQQYETAQRLKQLEVQRQIAFDSLNRVQEKFQLEMTHQQAIRRKDRTVGLVAATGLGLLVIALVRMLYFRRRSQRLQVESDAMARQQLLNEVALLRTQVNPHFLFNSLSILTSLVHVDALLAEQFIDQLSRSYRYILEQKENTLVSLRTELEFIQSYAFLLKIRFENKFDVQIDLPEEVLDHLKIAPLTLQLLIENAVKHNRMSVKEPLVVTVSIEQPQTLLVKNPLRPRTTPAVSTGMGLQNIMNRYALLTDQPVWAGEAEDQFVVKVPLL